MVDRGQVTCTATLVPKGRVAEWTIIQEIITTRDRHQAVVHDSVPLAEVVFAWEVIEEKGS